MRAKALGARLDGEEFAQARDQLRRFYDAHFHLLDVGVALPIAASDAAQGSIGAPENRCLVEFAADSPLEGHGFELTVPREIAHGFEPSSFTFDSSSPFAEATDRVRN